MKKKCTFRTSPKAKHPTSTHKTLIRLERKRVEIWLRKGEGAKKPCGTHPEGSTKKKRLRMNREDVQKGQVENRRTYV